MASPISAPIQARRANSGPSGVPAMASAQRRMAAGWLSLPRRHSVARTAGSVSRASASCRRRSSRLGCGQSGFSAAKAAISAVLAMLAVSSRAKLTSFSATGSGIRAAASIASAQRPARIAVPGSGGGACCWRMARSMGEGESGTRVGPGGACPQTVWIGISNAESRKMRAIIPAVYRAEALRCIPHAPSFSNLTKNPAYK